jgi:hypothetical protein
MNAKRPAMPRAGNERRRRPGKPAGDGVRRGHDERRLGDARGDNRRVGEAQRGRPAREKRPSGSGPQTAPILRPSGGPARPKSASQAKARAKARKAKAPKIIRPPLRERLIARLASIDLRPRALVKKVPFVVLVIASLGLGLGVTMWLSTDSAERSYELGTARQTNRLLTQQKEALERDVLQAQAAPALAEAARDLGMVPSRDSAHLVQDPGGNWVVVGKPKPADGVPAAPLNVKLPDNSAPVQNAGPAREMSVRMPAAAPAPEAAPAPAAPAAISDAPHLAGPPPALGPAPGPAQPPAYGPAPGPAQPPAYGPAPGPALGPAPGPAQTPATSPDASLAPQGSPDASLAPAVEQFSPAVTVPAR